jgi:putative membrane protein
MSLPLVNAILNGTSFVLLCAGLAAIKSGRRKLHESLMYSAMAASAVFLGCYLYYHLVIQTTTPFRREGMVKTAYLVMLASHVILAMVNVPLVLRTVFLARRERWEEHKRWAKITLPVWLYVSITGVLVYLCLYVWNPPAAA